MPETDGAQPQTKFPCAGCGKMIDTEIYASDRWTTFDLAPGRKVYVCGSSRSTLRGAKLSCVQTLLEKNKVCQGCGGELQYWPIQRICDECLTKLDYAEEVQKDRRLKRETVTFKASDVSRVAWHSSQYAQAAVAIRDVILRVAAAASAKKPYVRSADEVQIRVRARQVKALGRVTKAMHDLWESAHAIGYEEGRNLLMGLATGKLTPDQFSEKELERARKQQEG